MKRVYNILFGIVAMVLAVACGGDDSPVGEKWGYTKCYEDFLWDKYEPQLMERQLEIKLNPHAAALFEKVGKLTFYVSADKNKLVAPNGVDLYLNGEKCDNHRIVVDFIDVRSNNADTHVLNLNVGLMFTEVEDVEDYTLYFGYYTDDKFVSYNDRVDIDGVEDHKVVLAEDLQVDLGELGSVGVVVEQKVIMNPLLNILLWIFGSIITIFILSVIISRMMTPKIKVSYIALIGNYQQRVRVKGKRSVVFTNTRKKQGFWSKLYKGTILYNVHPSWVSDVTFEPRGDKLVMRFNSDNYACDNFLLQRNQHYTLNDLTNRTKIDINVL